MNGYILSFTHSIAKLCQFEIKNIILNYITFIDSKMLKVLVLITSQINMKMMVVT